LKEGRKEGKREDRKKGGNLFVKNGPTKGQSQFRFLALCSSGGNDRE
jgi:hypothetical protein